MSIEFEIEGLDELMNEFEKLANEETLKSCLDSCLKSIAQEWQEVQMLLEVGV